MGDIVGRLFREFADHPERHHSGFGGGLADADADDVRATAAAQAGIGTGLVLPAVRTRVSTGSSRFTARTLQVVLRHQPITLLVAVGTLVATIYLFLIMPKGFFPVQDTGVILGISEAPQTISFPAMARAAAGTGQGDSARIRRWTACRRSSASTAPTRTLNSGRIQINLKPLEERKISASDVIRRLQPQLAQVDGITLFMQPVQDLTVEDRVSRTQFQYTLEDPDAQGTGRVGAAVSSPSCKPLPRTARRGQRPAERGLAGHAGDRPRHRLALRHHAADDRRHALRRLRAAADLDHVHAVEPVPRGAGGQAGVSARIRTS